MPASNTRIGTSNIVLPGPKKDFPEPFRTATRLTYYSSLFNTVELNSPFYKVPQATTFQKWSAETTANFEFTVKLWRNITHTKTWTVDEIDFFIKVINTVGNKKGCLLIQFPASIKATHHKQLEKILQRINIQGEEWKKAVEFRDKSWYSRDICQLLDYYNAAVVLHDMPASGTQELNEAASFVYCRFHGEKGDYRGNYSRKALEKTAEHIQHWEHEGKEVYVYFNNTIGNAFENARTLQQLCH